MLFPFIVDAEFRETFWTIPRSKLLNSCNRVESFRAVFVFACESLPDEISSGAFDVCIYFSDPRIIVANHLNGCSHDCTISTREGTSRLMRSMRTDSAIKSLAACAYVSVTSAMYFVLVAMIKPLSKLLRYWMPQSNSRRE